MTKQSEDQIKIGNVDIKKADSDENTESMSTGSATEPLNPEKQSSLTRQSPKLNVVKPVKTSMYSQLEL